MRFKNKEFKIGAIIAAVLLVISIISIFITPHDPFAMDALVKFSKPTSVHLFGTDNLGRDILSRTLVGLRYTYFISITTVLISSIIGVTIGLICSYMNRVLDQVLMRIIDAINSIPTILITLVMVSLLSTSIASLIFALSIIFVPSFVRITRNQAIQIKELEYIQHAKVLGASTVRIMFFHILPSLLPTVLSTFIIATTNAIMAESALSYLGMGIQPPIPSLGRMLFEAQAYLFNAPWGAVFPGSAIIILVMGFHYIGNGIIRN